MKHDKVVLDSSIWIELLREGPLVRKCAALLEGVAQVFVPTVVIFEVYKKIAVTLGEEHALPAIAMLTRHEVLDLTREIALAAADLAIVHKLAMADSLVLAHAQRAGAILVTLDNDFAGLPAAEVIRS